MATKQVTITKIIYEDAPQKPKVGDIVYLTSVQTVGSVPSTSHIDETSYNVQYNMPKTNQGVDMPDGWLGDWLDRNTTSIHYSHGKYEVKKVIDKKSRDLEVDEKYTLKLKKVSS